jgi:hypothetical protein
MDVIERPSRFTRVQSPSDVASVIPTDQDVQEIIDFYGPYHPKIESILRFYFPQLEDVIGRMLTVSRMNQLQRMSAFIERYHVETGYGLKNAFPNVPLSFATALVARYQHQ